jgi:periplasmic divalent cation tolerance protein
MNDIIVFYVPMPSIDEAKALAKALLCQRLVGCANIYKSHSLFWWEGQVKDDCEYTVMAKTLPDKEEAAELEIKNIHPYSIPAILKIKASCNSEYAAWLQEEVTRQQ